MKEMETFLIGMDHDVWDIDFPHFCKRVHDEIPDANGFELSFEHPDLFRLFPSKEVVSYINDTISSYDYRNLSLHSLTKDINISSYNPRIRETSFNEIVQSLDLFSHINIGHLYFLVHGGQNSFRTPSKFSKQNLPNSVSNHIDNLIRLNKICEDYGIELSVENLIYSSWRLTSKIEYLDDLFNEIPNLKLTFDIDHANFVSISYARKIFDKYASKINTVHVGLINNIYKLKKLLIPLKLNYVFEPHSVKNKFQIFQCLNKNIKILKGLIGNNKNAEIIVQNQNDILTEE